MRTMTGQSRRVLISLTALLALTAGGVGSAQAQTCDPEWTALDAGTDSIVRAVLVLPDGDVVAGGEFSMAGGVAAKSIARWDSATGGGGTGWSALSSGTNGNVYSLALLQSGELVASGIFSTAGDGDASNVARWDFGTEAWSPLGAGTNNLTYSIAVRPNGDLVAGGLFTSADGSPASRVALWNGSSWSAMGSGVNSFVIAVAALPNNDVLAGGNFTTADGNPASKVARWDHASGTWTAMGGGMNGVVSSFVVLPNNDVFAGGTFTTADGLPANRVAKWDGSGGGAGWSALGSGLDANVYGMARLSGGNLVVGGAFTLAGGAPASKVARWNGSAWSALGTGMDAELRSIAAMPGNELVAGGAFTIAGGVPANRVARWVCVQAPCYPDCDGDSVLTIDDFICFQTFFALGDAYADCDADSTLTIDDFICFQTFFAIGC